MARLVILRGDAHYADIQLPEHTVQIGRSPQNEIVLEDHGKGVSRTHAELRFEEGRHVLVDRASQNGIWVSGSRVTSVALTPGVIASLGPYRLEVETSELTAEVAASEDRTEIAVRPGRQLPPVEESPTPGGPAEEDGSPVAQPIDGRRLAGRSPWEKHRVIVLTTAAVLLLGVVGYAVYTVLRPANPAPPADAWLTAATEMVNAGHCADALVQHIEPALARNPKDPSALKLKERCQPPPPPETPEPVPPAGPTAAELLLTDAEGLLAGNQKPANKECQAALGKVNEVLAADPANERGLALKTNVEGCLQAPTKRAPAPLAWIAAVDPENGGLRPGVNETPEAHAERVRYAQLRVAEAQKQATAGDYAGAEKALSGPPLPNNFKGLPELLEDVAQGKKRRQAADLIDDARAAANRNELLQAIDLLRGARDLDPSMSIDKEIQDLDSRRLQRAQSKCNAAEARWVYRPSEETRTLYAEALKLLRPGEPCYAEALQRSK